MFSLVKNSHRLRLKVFQRRFFVLICNITLIVTYCIVGGANVPFQSMGVCLLSATRSDLVDLMHKTELEQICQTLYKLKLMLSGYNKAIVTFANGLHKNGKSYVNYLDNFEAPLPYYVPPI